MKKENSFKMNSCGRCGSITYETTGHKIEIDWEMSGVSQYDILLAPVDLREWNEPKGVAIPIETQIEILQKLREWAKKQKLKTDIDAPTGLDSENKLCGRTGCDEHRLHGSVYCRNHFDESLLRK